MNVLPLNESLPRRMMFKTTIQGVTQVVRKLRQTQFQTQETIKQSFKSFPKNWTRWHLAQVVEQVALINDQKETTTTRNTSSTTTQSSINPTFRLYQGFRKDTLQNDAFVMLKMHVHT